VESPEVGSFLEDGEMRVQGAAKESSEEGNQSVVETSSKISVFLRDKVSASWWGGSVEVLGQIICWHEELQ